MISLALVIGLVGMAGASDDMTLRIQQYNRISAQSNFTSVPNAPQLTQYPDWNQEKFQEIESDIFTAIRWMTSWQQWNSQRRWIKAFRDSSRDEFKRASTLYFLGIGYLNQDKYDAAAWTWSRALTEVQESDNDQQRELKDLIQLALGVAASTTGHMSDAVSWFNKIPPTSPHVFRANQLAMELYFRTGKYDQALTCAESAILAMDSQMTTERGSPSLKAAALRATLLAAHIYLQRNQIMLAKEAYLRTSEITGRLRQSVLSQLNFNRLWDTAMTSPVDPFAISHSQTNPLYDYLSVRDYRWIEHTFHEARNSRALNQDTEQLRSAQHALAQSSFSFGVKSLLHQLAITDLNARIGIENVLWKDRAEVYRTDFAAREQIKKMRNLAKEQIDALRNE